MKGACRERGRGFGGECGGMVNGLNVCHYPPVTDAYKKKKMKQKNGTKTKS